MIENYLRNFHEEIIRVLWRKYLRLTGVFNFGAIIVFKKWSYCSRFCMLVIFIFRYVNGKTRVNKTKASPRTILENCFGQR